VNRLHKDNAFVSNMKVVRDAKIEQTALERVNRGQHSRIEITLFVVDRKEDRLPTFRT